MYKTTITSTGPIVDGRVIQAGSVLVTKAEPPSTWRRMGDVERIGDAPKKVMIVNPETVADDGLQPETVADERAVMVADYEELTGKKPDGRWSNDRLRDELAKACE